MRRSDELRMMRRLGGAVIVLGAIGWLAAPPRESPPPDVAPPVVSRTAPTPPPTPKPMASDWLGREETAPPPAPDRRALAIYRDLIAADDEAIWLANRLYAPDREPEKHQAAYREHLAQTHRAVEERYRITPGQREQIAAAGLAGDWPRPEYPSFNPRLVAMQRELSVYVNTDSPIYHRAGCPDLDNRRPLRKVNLAIVLAQPGAQACPTCEP